MATRTQPSPSHPRLSLFGFGSISRNASSSQHRALEQQDTQEQDDDWYIPYNGPIEQPSQRGAPGDRDSWGDILSGWLSERGGGSSQGVRDEAGVGHQGQQYARARAVSNASQLTTSSAHKGSYARSLQHRPSVPSFIDLDKAGGVGASPMPQERSQQAPHPQPPPPGNRASFASILSFGRKSLHHSPSLEQLTRERGSLRRRANPSASTSTAPIPPQPRHRATEPPPPTNGLHQEPIAEDNEYYYSSLLVHSSTRGVPNRQSPFSTNSSPHSSPHPYAAALRPGAEPPQSAPPAPVKGKTRFVDPSKLSLTLLDPHGPKVADYLKPSPRNSLLKASISTPNLRDIPKGKQRWLSAETWCDALILPRPRFAMRLVDGGPSGRIVSPPGSPVSPSEAKLSSRDGSAQSHRSKSLKKARSMGNLLGAAKGSSPVKEMEKARSPESNDAGPSHLKPNRPKSWALDDLALPSPVPSLAQVVAEGERLQAERKEWQSKATQSFQNKRIRSVRSRSKSLGASQIKPRSVSATAAQPSTFNLLAERTLLGSQVRPPTIHVHGPPKGHQRIASTVQTRSSSFSQPISNAQTQSRTGTGSRARSHGHSNSVGHTVSFRSVTNESSAHGHGYGHARSQSLGKSALKIVKNTAVGAAALCGINGIERSPTIANDDRANAFEGALRHNNTTMVKVGENGNVLVMTPTSPTAALAMVSPQPGINGVHGASPTPSGMSMSAEGVGLAISSPDDQPQVRKAPEEPIFIPSHPYAQGSNWRQPTKLNIPEYTGPESSSNSPQSATTDSTNQRRKPVTHPYVPGPMPQAHTHPYAMNQLRPRPQHLNLQTNTPAIYAELSPGHISEFDPEQIQYSPYVLSPVEGPSATAESEPPQKHSPHLQVSGHPYGPSVSRYSELGIGEALTHTLRNQTSMDSGLGTSEGGGHTHGQGQTHIPAAQTQILQPQKISPPVMLQSPESDELNKQTPGFFDSDSPGNRLYQRSAAASSQALASSPLNEAPPFRRRGSSSGTRLSTTQYLEGPISASGSGSSPGRLSQASSPPLSPRPLPMSGDLDRFRDLFYRPTDRLSVASQSPLSASQASQSPMSESPRSRLGASRQNSLPLDVSSQASRSVSGLTNLARQLSEDLEELRSVERDLSNMSDRDSPMWGRRFGGLRGERPEDMMDDPNVVLSQSRVSSEDSSSPVGGTTLPLRLPSEGAFANPASNFPEDIGIDETESSRASSVLEGSNFHDDPTQYLRVGEVEASSTPPVVTSPHRASTRLSLVDDQNSGVSNMRPPTQDEDNLSPLRVPSQYSSLPSRYSSFSAPLSLPDGTRMSYMTTDTEPSRMSGLSDFPVPPTNINHTPSVPFDHQQSSTEEDYYTAAEAEQTSSDTHTQTHPYSRAYSQQHYAQGQTLLREPSKDTFGVQHEYDHDIGEAF